MCGDEDRWIYLIMMNNCISREGLPEAVQGRMYSAIQGRGAFRRFRDMIIKMGIEQVWYDFKADTYKRKAARWCEEKGIEYE